MGIRIEHKQFLSSWTSTLQLNLGEWGEVLFCHGTPRSNMEIFTSLTPEENLVPIFSDLAVSLVICGHTHMQFDRTIGNVRVVNAGSIGMPFGRTGADWLLLDTDIHFKHTDYDITKAAERIRKSDYPQAEDFVVNNVLQAPSEKIMFEMLTRMEVNDGKKIA